MDREEARHATRDTDDDSDSVAMDSRAVDSGAVEPGAVEPGARDAEIDTSVVDRIEEQLADVELALARIDDGTYGRCEVCNEAFSDAELEQAPAARFCRAHLPMSLA